MPSRRFREIFAFIAYPAVVSFTVLIAWLLYGQGVGAATATALSFLMALALTYLLEQLFPRAVRPEAKVTAKEAGQDSLYLLLAASIQKLFGAAVHAIPAGLVATVAGAQSSARWWVVLAVFLIGDAGKYGMHRLAHEHPWWWRFHETHHAPTKVYSLNGVRVHPVNLLWNLAFDMALPALVGLDAASMVVLSSFRGAISVLQHAAFEVRGEVFGWVFSTPELHRWHHSTDREESMSNYGSTLIVWDTLFGTRYAPTTRGEPRRIGLSGEAKSPGSFFGQIVAPFAKG